MSTYIIRSGTKSDLESLMPLFDQLGYPKALFELEKQFNRFIRCEGYGVAVACQSFKIIGWVAWSRTPFFLTDKTRFHIEGLVVDQNYRRLGIGKKLINSVEQIAKQFSPAVVDLTTNVRRQKDGSHDFYKALGYKNESLTEKRYFRKEV